MGVGALNLDRLYLVERIASAGDEVPVISSKEAPGGSAANTIVGLARLGAATGFIGRVGDDMEGEFLLEAMEREGVDRGGIKVCEGDSGLVLAFVDRRGERAMYAYPGVNDALAMDDALGYARRARIVHMSSFVGDRSYEAQRRLASELGGVKISLAPGTLYARRGLEEMEAILKKCEVLFLNREEIGLLTGKGYEEGAALLRAKGVRNVAVTLGPEGCYVLGDEGLHLPAYRTEVVDTTGAGDAFAAGFLFGMLHGQGAEACGRLGNRCASLCVSKVGARDGLPHRRELEGFLREIEWYK